MRHFVCVIGLVASLVLSGSSISARDGVSMEHDFSVISRRDVRADAYAFATRWAPGPIVVKAYTAQEVGAWIPQAYQEWTIASNGLLTFDVRQMGYNSECQNIEPGEREIIVCTCPATIQLDGQSVARCVDGAGGYTGYVNNWIDRSGEFIVGSRALLSIVSGTQWVDTIDALLCHEAGHTVGLDHPPTPADSCVLNLLPAPGSADAQELQRVLAIPIETVSSDTVEKMDGKHQKHKKSGKNQKHKKRGKQKKH